ncbi:gamma-glutamylcyclotransferase (GGCT)/AIG2-like uncharacterized protein YtfP [Litorivivens lipolytica]|uniref:Gamma-glutamylcyclotransferase (GGCT)/AIG2-like uncharacterized protein YtfP n=1 Tax=Litorivivens lipolytica TaxID=1524264 RepID=A0A7W4Z5R7_9GAMM|nr:gamma-glutamylcyclotransferase family protein [Litorivivens lipolytica]MBB3046145.1 gamma-glutamylcyclotransferase (GGCT)/AIG2-like uncharacterized protein YtfP [Litorivivens lipolytica]
MSDYYFAYGSNMNPERMRARGLAFTRFEAGRLSGFRLSFNKRAHNKTGIAYANISRDPDGLVEGVLYQLEGDIQVMDPFEGTPVRYSRELFAIETAVGVTWAWVYVANPAYIADALSVEENYLNHLLSAGELLSEAYRQQLAQLAPVLASTAPQDRETGLRFNV